MTPKARSDIHMNLPALRKLDSMLIVSGSLLTISVIAAPFFLLISWGIILGVRKPWIRWWTQNFGMRKGAAEQKEGAEVPGTAWNGGFHPLEFPILVSQPSKGRSWVSGESSFNKFWRPLNPLIKTFYWKCLFLLLSEMSSPRHGCNRSSIYEFFSFFFPVNILLQWIIISH